ncbi:LacI family DNA-binding transcriptional regulator [Alkalihalobacillus sp. MEB130]|uniref:LacI family DNA-binding transcriptional regulator n=1 Tax=Alkalihalobacillus sp. MEB130 TaxID=2976704 RepID=UPI0028E0043D|nr:LacI family DNA-binding transcriptional regulator [Alkalihalobacillus sp. MEB130]MDT8859915.1 LacI family DNA-binding transcriptional regulator [Alkalihalobacillus sp. MEB130]
MSKKKITSMDVAKLAGVSQSTVSRVFGSGANVSEKKRNQILEAAELLGYQPNAIARGLITNKTNMIGIVMRNIQNPFYPEVLEKFYTRLAEKGYHLIFMNSEHNFVQEDEISHLIEYHVDGVIITDALLSSSAVQRFLKNDIAIILFNRYIENPDYSAVFCDNFYAGQEIGNYLVKTGHKHFAFISGPLETSTTIDRKKGFEQALAKHGYFDIAVEIGNYSYESGFEAAKKLLQSNKIVDSIFCGNDITALGAIDAAKSLGYNIPEDLSVIGFDDINMASWPSYSLTTWKQPIEDMVNQTIDLLLHEMDEEEKSVSSHALPGELIIRGSVRQRE